MQGIVASAIASMDAMDLNALGSAATVSQAVASSAHPRLYLNKARLAHLSERFYADGTWADKLRSDGDKMIEEKLVPELVAEEGGGQQAHYGKPARQISFMAITLGLFYQLTKDERYAKKLHEAMVFYCAYKRWGGPGLVDRNPPWHSELDTSQFCFGYAVAYDALYSFLTTEQRQQIRESVIRLGILPTLNDWILPGRRFHSLDSMGHNWWGVCVSGAGVAALAFLGEEERAQSWIEAIDDGLVEWFSYEGNVLHNRIETFESPDGPSYEGVNYTGYGVTTYLRYLLAWRTMFPARTHPAQRFVSGIPEFFLHTLYPTPTGSLPVNFDDTHENSTAADCILLLRACGVKDEYGRRYLLHAQREGQDPLPLYVPEDAAAATSVALPLSKVYPKMGWAMMRTSWDPTATLLAVKSGATWNHAHADAGTFLLMHKGHPLIIDSGTCNYAWPEYSSYYRQSEAHNVVLFDGVGQPKDQIDIGNKFRGSITSWFDGHGLRYIGADATGPLAYIAKRCYRHFVWIGNVILIFDDIATHRDVDLDWLLHSKGDVKQQDSRSILIQNEESSVLVNSLYPSGVKIQQREGLAAGDRDRRVPYHAFTFQTRNARQRAITALDLDPERRTRIECREQNEALEVTVQAAAETHRVYLNLRSIDGAYNMSSTISIGEWSTDAYLLALSSSGNEPASPSEVSRLLILDGSFLRHKDGSVFESLSKASCLWRPSRAEVYTQSQRRSSLAIYLKDRPDEVQWNGKRHRGSYDGASRMLRLQSLL